MKQKKFKTHPYVVGIVSNNLQRARPLQKKFATAFKKANVHFLYLLLKTKPEYLKIGFGPYAAYLLSKNLLNIISGEIKKLTIYL